MESKAYGFDPLLKAYGFGLRIPDLFTGGNYAISNFRAGTSCCMFLKARLCQLNCCDI
jgi:hypothetical protein